MTKQENLLNELNNNFDENKLTEEDKIHLETSLETYAKKQIPSIASIEKTRREKAQAMESLNKKTVDEVFDIANTELDRQGITLYGTNGPIHLTPIQHKFAIGYFKSGSVKEAMRFLGNKSKNGWQKDGYALINDPQVAEAISVLEKQHILASGLTELEVISGIRDIAMLAREKGRYAPALKAFALLGDYLGMWDKSKNPSKNQGISHNNLQINVENFITSKGGNEAQNKESLLNDVKNFGEALGISLTPFRPETIRDITAETILVDEEE